MRLKNLITFSFLIVFLTGCVSFPKLPEPLKFYGIEVSSEIYDNDYVRKENNRFSYLEIKMNPKISAHGSFGGLYFEISVCNKSDKPLRTNYFMDKFNVYTKDNKQYVLKSDNITNYPKGYINPGDYCATFYLDKPRALSGNNILKTVVKLADGTRIVLKPDVLKPELKKATK